MEGNLGPGGEVELERTKARPKPGLVSICGRMEKTNWVEKDVSAVEFGRAPLMAILEGKKARPYDHCTESLVSLTTLDCTLASLMRRTSVELPAPAKELNRKSTAREGQSKRR